MKHMAKIFTRVGALNGIVSLVLLIALSVQAVPSKAPAGSPTDHNLELWYNISCSTGQIRHPRSPQNMELRFIYNLVKATYKEFKSLYGANFSSIKPQGDCPRFRNLMRPLKSASNYSLARQEFFKSLTVFSAIAQHLVNIKIETEIGQKHQFDRRTELLNRTYSLLSLGQCELLDEIKKDPNRPPFQAPRSADEVVRCLPNVSDLSQAEILDVSFMKKLNKFMRNGQRLLKRKKGRTESRMNKKKLSSHSKSKSKTRTKKRKNRPLI